MLNRGTIVEFDDVRIEVDQAFRGAGYIHPSGANYLALSTTRRFPHSTFSVNERKNNMSSYIL